MADLPDIQSTFDSSLFRAACEDVFRIVSILSLSSSDVQKPEKMTPTTVLLYERGLFLQRFFYLLFVKGFTPMVFEVMPYQLWRLLSLAIYVYRLSILPLFLRIIGYGKYADWSTLGSNIPAPDSEDGKCFQNISLSRTGRLSQLDFGDPDSEKFFSKLLDLSAHLWPHSQSPGNPFTHVANTPGNFFNHLTGVYKVLLAWKQPKFVIRGGLFHSVYGTFDYRSGIFDLRDGREPLSTLIGKGAEELAFAICTSDRIGLIIDLIKIMYGDDAKKVLNDAYPATSKDGNAFPSRKVTLSKEGFPVRNHITQAVHVFSPEFFAQFVIVMIADFMEQGAILFGNSDSDLCLFQFMRFRFYADLIQFVKPYLRVIPPVWEKYMSDDSDYVEPLRCEIIDFKRIYVTCMSDWESHVFNNKTDKTDFICNSLGPADITLLVDMVKKYPYLAEPKIVLAACTSPFENKDTAFSRCNLASAGLLLLEEWGMLSVKSGKKGKVYSLKDIMLLVKEVNSN